MKTKLLFLGTLFCLLVATPLYAQETRKMEKKEMKQLEIINPPKAKLVPIKKRVVHGRIDTITGERIPPYKSGTPSKKFAIIFPPSSLQYPNSNFYVLGEPDGGVQLHGEAPGGRTVEVKMLSLRENGIYRVVQDWTPHSVSPEGDWGTAIGWDPVPAPGGQSVKFKVLARDTANRSEVITLYVGRE